MYFAIIDKAKTEQHEYYEKHHIIPKCVGGTNKKSNLVKLSARQHYLCHLLLPHMVDDKRQKYKFVCAFNYLNNTKKKYTNRYTSKLYETHKLSLSQFLSEKFSGEGNPMHGRKHSEETLKKISIANSISRLTEEGRRKKSEYMKQHQFQPMNNPEYVEKMINKISKKYSVTLPTRRDNRSQEYGAVL